MSTPIHEDLSREIRIAMTAQGQGALRALAGHLRALAMCLQDVPTLVDCRARTESAAQMFELLADGPTAMLIGDGPPPVPSAPKPTHGAGRPS